MPWRLVGTVIILGIILLFIGFNLENRCDISFGFTTLTNTPVYLTAFSAFVLGLFCAIPFAISLRRKSTGKKTQEADPAGALDSNPEKKKWFKKKEKPLPVDEPPVL